MLRRRRKRWPTPVEINRVGQAFAHAMTTAITGTTEIDRSRLRPPAEIRQYCNDPRWFIVMSAPLKDPRVLFDATDCPGSLHEDFDTARQAALVAAWWGYEPMLTEPCPSHRIRQRDRNPVEHRQ